ncbi:MAG TPA: hypothetical protein VF546_03695 [Pyrinomonadaceae bacterium]|jgi:hypothetical protein
MSKKSPYGDEQESAAANDKLEQGSRGGPATGGAAGDLTELIRRLSAAGGVPITLSTRLPDPIPTDQRLTDLRPLSVAFPPCAEELLALINTRPPTDDPATPEDESKVEDEITQFFSEYFKFRPHHTIQGNPDPLLDPALVECLKGPDEILLKQQARAGDQFGSGLWPSECCVCAPCVTLNGNRNALNTSARPKTAIKRLFIGDLVWLFYFERMGLFQILGAILDAYACNGRLPISNGSIELGLKDDIIALVLEVMVRQTKMGLSSTVRDRGCAYRTSLGWTSNAARRLNLDTQVNAGFSTLFHQFIYYASGFYKEKNLAVAIRGTAATVAPPSVATLITISDTLEVLKKRFELFQYGRNYYNTLSGIVWVVAALSVVRDLRTTLGIPPAFNDPHEFIPAAYDLLVLKRPASQGDTNRYIVHRDCARYARDILLDLEVINHRENEPGRELENWLTQIEGKVEGYRAAYRTLTGVDLGAAGTPAVEQQV